MKIFLFKNNLKNLFSNTNPSLSYSVICILNKNKSLRFNLNHKNICFYKLKNINKTFCNLEKSKSLNSPKNSDNSEDLDSFLNSLDENKKISLKLYEKSEIVKPSENKNLPQINSQLVGNDELEIFTPNKELSKSENFKMFKIFLDRKDKHENEYKNHSKKVALSMFILLMGLFSLWVPLYKTICESQGFSVKTTHSDYKFDGRKRKIKNNF